MRRFGDDALALFKQLAVAAAVPAKAIVPALNEEQPATRPSLKRDTKVDR